MGAKFLLRVQRTGRKPYNKAMVLMLKWDDDDLGVTLAEDDLKKVFQDIYYFPAEHYVLSSNNANGIAENGFSYVILSFLPKHDGSNNLCVLRSCDWERRSVFIDVSLNHYSPITFLTIFISLTPITAHQMLR